MGCRDDVLADDRTMSEAGLRRAGGPVRIAAFCGETQSPPICRHRLPRERLKGLLLARVTGGAAGAHQPAVERLHVLADVDDFAASTADDVNVIAAREEDE